MQGKALLSEAKKLSSFLHAVKYGRASLHALLINRWELRETIAHVGLRGAPSVVRARLPHDPTVFAERTRSGGPRRAPPPIVNNSHIVGTELGARVGKYVASQLGQGGPVHARCELHKRQGSRGLVCHQRWAHWQERCAGSGLTSRCSGPSATANTQQAWQQGSSNGRARRPP